MSAASSSKLDWIVLGGGIHGVHLAVRLLAEAKVDRDRLRIVDPARRLLHRWRACTAVTGMKHLRSAGVHHLDTSPWSLQRYAGKRRRRRPGSFAPPYDRPALKLFNEHCDKVIDSFGLKALHLQDRGVHCALDCDGVRLELEGGGALRAHNLLLALGASEQPLWPNWALQDHPRVQHVFQPGFDGWPPSAGEALRPEQVAVVGGGISAGQIALRLANEGHLAHLVSRHAFRRHQFDSDPGWLGPKNMADFSREPDPDRRRALITKARHRGSMPPDVLRALRRAIERGRVHVHEAGVDSLRTCRQRDSADPTDGSAGLRRMVLQFSGGGHIAVDRVLLATGFEARRPGGALVDELVEAANLPCAACGYPIVDPTLCWHPGIYVAGPLAELELGPVARNIAGARRAGIRLVRAATRQRSGPVAAAR